MKASVRQQQLLLALQELDTQLARCSRKLARLPEREEISQLAAVRQSAKEKLMSAQREADVLSADLQRLASDVEMMAQRRARDEELLQNSSSVKEIQALQDELAKLGTRTAEVEEKQLEAMEAQESALAELAEAEEVLNGLDAKHAELAAKIQAAETEIAAERARLEEERAGQAAEIQRDLLEFYEDLRSRLGVAVARLRGGVSEASNMALNPAELSALQAVPADELAFCPTTGAILVREFTE